YLPLDHSSPAARLEILLAEVPLAALLTQDRLAGRFRASGVPVIRLDADWEAVARRSSRRPPSGSAALNLAYVMYTSGSNGRPKGVAVVHRAVVRLVREAGYADFAPGQVFLQLAPLAFDASTFEIWGALANGGRLVLMPPGPSSLEEIGRVIRRHQVTTLWLTAGLFHLLVDERPEDLRPVRQLLAGGDVLSPAHVERALNAAGGGLRLINGYGPTEGTTFTCCHPMGFPGEAGVPVPLGRPIANARVLLADRHLRPVPIGVVGELCIGGDGLARGYFGQPALTAASFVPDPFDAAGGEPGGRLYRTGDLSRFLADGRIEFIGRIDAQVKIRGFRIEPGEVEGILAGHPEVGSAAVVVREERSGDRRLVACAVARPGSFPATGELHAYMADRLPEHMLPAEILLLESLPLSANGKVDRRALAALPPQEQESLAAVETPRTQAEELLAALWAEVLGRERIGLHESFFDLGGHSLLATQAISRIRRAFGVELPLRAVFE